MIKIGIVGSRRVGCEYEVRNFVGNLTTINDSVEVVSGCCPKGPDFWAETEAKNLGLKFKGFPPKLPPKWKPYFEHVRAYYKRNQQVADYVDFLVAFVTEARKGGTEDTIARTKQLGKIVFIVEPSFVGDLTWVIQEIENLSATNRSKPADPLGRYLTKKWAIEAVIEETGIKSGDLVLDPGCGTGNIAEVLLEFGCDVVGIEIDKNLARKCKRRLPEMTVIRGNFLTSKKLKKYAPFDAIMGNPPFVLSEDFWNESWEYLKEEDSRIIFFQRLGFMESIDRRYIFDEGSGFRYLYVSPRRPFPDAATYAWYRWESDFEGEANVKRLHIPGYDY
jgi:SAM-dependent methyltransferase